MSQQTDQHAAQHQHQPKPAKPQALTRSDFGYFAALTTRWADNDIYGHVNNVMYYSFFDTTANRYLIEHGGLDIHDGDIIGLVVDSGCSYFAPIAFPDQLQGALRVAHLGKSSVRYELAIFKVPDASNMANETTENNAATELDQMAVAQGHFVHVFVDRITRKPVAIPEQMRAALMKISI